MVSLKRKSADAVPQSVNGQAAKKQKTSVAKSKSLRASSKPDPPESISDDLIESDTTETTNDFEGLSDSEPLAVKTPVSKREHSKKNSIRNGANGSANGVKPKPDALANCKPAVGKQKRALTSTATSSKEAHAKQKALAKERKAAKPNADSVQRSKKIWERLRRKSHVPKEERDDLVKELYDIVTGRVKEFVFKHDSVRVVQCALKYAKLEQKKMIARELKGEYRTLAESRYAKFLIGKLMVEGDRETRDMIIPEFYGHVRRLINHPEASWILDDIYRGIANPEQKATLLREWYGSEFAIFKSASKDVTATLSTILEEAPEKRKPIMSYLYSLINQLIQKKMTGFTMLHDAMLQYFLNTKPGTEEGTEFLELLKGDEEGDLLKNLAFTKSGARGVCLALAYGSAKDRKHILRVYKDNIETLAYDANGHLVLTTAFDVVDDTRLLSQAIISELLAVNAPEDARQEKILALVTHLNGRISVLYPFAGKAKWLLSEGDGQIIDEIRTIRATTSKKDPEVRRREICATMSKPLLETIAAQAPALAASSFGCQFMTEVLLDADGDKAAAVTAVADLAVGDPTETGHIANSPFGGRMLKTLALGGRFDQKSKKTIPVDPPLGFGNALYVRIEEFIVEWACGASSFVVVNLLEAGDFEKKDEVIAVLRKRRAEVEEAAGGKTGEVKGKGSKAEDGNGVSSKTERKDGEIRGNQGARLLLERLG